MNLLPERPARILDMGCGTGWTSKFMSLNGHNVVGVDISEQMIEIAKKSEDKGLAFQVGDYESINGADGFDVVVFFDSLHHAEDEFTAIKSAYKSLKPGGIALIYEPGSNHSETKESIQAVKNFDVHEKDMPPKYVCKLARAAGFRKTQVFPDIERMAYYACPRKNRTPWIDRIARWVQLNLLVLFFKKDHGITLLTK
jgi:SAM-dependent methyltransferase